MDYLNDPIDILREIVSEYAKAPHGGKSYVMQSLDHNAISVVDVYTFQGKHYADAGLIVRIVNDSIIIELDLNDKPLVDALVQAGIPREKIILAYAGEPVPDIATP